MIQRKWEQRRRSRRIWEENHGKRGNGCYDEVWFFLTPSLNTTANPEHISYRHFAVTPEWGPHMDTAKGGTPGEGDAQLGTNEQPQGPNREKPGHQKEKQGAKEGDDGEWTTG